MIVDIISIRTFNYIIFIIIDSFGGYILTGNYSSSYNSGNSSTISNDLNNNDDDIGIPIEVIQKNFILIIIAMLIMAYVIAAGVEETMKHFAIRCCRFPYPLQDPHSVRIYLMTAALGFATSENIEYVFGTKTSPIPGYK